MDVVDASQKVTTHEVGNSPIDKALLVSNLVKSAKTGDLDAFDSLTLMFRERLYGVIYNMTFNHDDAADLTQDAFVKAFCSLSKFKEKASFLISLLLISLSDTITPQSPDFSRNGLCPFLKAASLKLSPSFISFMT